MRGRANLVERRAERREGAEPARPRHRARHVDGEDDAVVVIEARPAGARRQAPAVLQVGAGEAEGSRPSFASTRSSVACWRCATAGWRPTGRADTGSRAAGRPSRTSATCLLRQRDATRRSPSRAMPFVKRNWFSSVFVPASIGRPSRASRRLVGANPRATPDRLVDRVEPHRPRTAVARATPAPSCTHARRPASAGTCGRSYAGRLGWLMRLPVRTAPTRQVESASGRV